MHYLLDPGGALTPIGMGNTITTLIKNGFVDWIVTTGANVYHDLHFAYDLPVRQGHFQVDDDVLYSKQIVRIYDVYIKEVGTLQAQDIIIQREIKKLKRAIMNLTRRPICLTNLAKQLMKIQ